MSLCVCITQTNKQKKCKILPQVSSSLNEDEAYFSFGTAFVVFVHPVIGMFVVVVVVGLWAHRGLNFCEPLCSTDLCKVGGYFEEDEIPGRTGGNNSKFGRYYDWKKPHLSKNLCLMMIVK